MRTTWPLGVVVLPPISSRMAPSIKYGAYIHEILGHAGICYKSIPYQRFCRALDRIQVLLTLGETRLSPKARNSLCSWVRSGGAWITVAGTCGLADMIGVNVDEPDYDTWATGVSNLGEGYVLPRAPSHPVLSHLSIPLHFFNGLPVRTAGAVEIAGVLDSHQRETRRASVAERRVGRGRVMLIAPDITGAVVTIQQGSSVTRKGIPPPGDRGSRCDRYLKTIDGIALDWSFDRQPVPGADGLQGFLTPIADSWRELLLRAVFFMAQSISADLPLLWLYPRGLPALAHMSLDSDGNEPDKARLLLERLTASGLRTTWCILAPGYPRTTMAAIRRAGHECGMHYDAVSPNPGWSEQAFDAQWRSLARSLRPDSVKTNKNHYLRWEGDVEFFDWCAKRGVLIDQSKGPSKMSEVGFAFGTCHPYFPVRPNGELIQVIELPVLTHDVGIFAPAEACWPILRAVLQSHGVFHVVFHPAYARQRGFLDAVTDVIAKVRGYGLEWWTSSEIRDWECIRRSAIWKPFTGRSRGRGFHLTLGGCLTDASVLWLARDGMHVAGSSIGVGGASVCRWGFCFLPCELQPRTPASYTFELDS